MSTRDGMKRHTRRYHRRERHAARRWDQCRDRECRWTAAYLAERLDCPHGDLYPAAEQACHEEVTR